MSEHKPKLGDITLWKNEKYEVGGNQPYARGKGVDLNGTNIEVTLWIPKSDKMMDRAFNLTMKPDNYRKQIKQTNQQEEKEPTDLPF